MQQLYMTASTGLLPVRHGFLTLVSVCLSLSGRSLLIKYNRNSASFQLFFTILCQIVTVNHGSSETFLVNIYYAA